MIIESLFFYTSQLLHFFCSLAVSESRKSFVIFIEKSKNAPIGLKIWTSSAPFCKELYAKGAELVPR
uniref:Uncharacterized protein n=1 Tax=Caenorhabditis japonica TaxID=281687 RepID=A0A8R1E750_CAEJA